MQLVSSAAQAEAKMDLDDLRAKGSAEITIGDLKVPALIGRNSNRSEPLALTLSCAFVRVGHGGVLGQLL